MFGIRLTCLCERWKKDHGRSRAMLRPSAPGGTPPMTPNRGGYVPVEIALAEGLIVHSPARSSAPFPSITNMTDDESKRMALLEFEKIVLQIRNEALQATAESLLSSEGERNEFRSRVAAATKKRLHDLAGAFQEEYRNPATASWLK